MQFGEGRGQQWVIERVEPARLRPFWLLKKPGAQGVYEQDVDEAVKHDAGGDLWPAELAGNEPDGVVQPVVATVAGGASGRRAGAV